MAKNHLQRIRDDARDALVAEFRKFSSENDPVRAKAMWSFFLVGYLLAPGGTPKEESAVLRGAREALAIVDALCREATAADAGETP